MNAIWLPIVDIAASVTQRACADASVSCKGPRSSSRVRAQERPLDRYFRKIRQSRPSVMAMCHLSNVLSGPLPKKR